MRMKLKNDLVDVRGIKPELLIGLNILYSIWKEHLEGIGTDMIITSLNDSTHSQTSLHYNGCAADVRTKAVDERNKASILREFKDSANEDFELILENEGMENEHFHLEFQPKRR